MTNRVGDLCDISSGPTRLFPSVCADDRLEEDDISEAGHLPGDDDQDDDRDEQDADEDDEEIEEPVALQLESVAHRLVSFYRVKLS